MSSFLQPDRYPQLDLFICNLTDISPKGDMATMEHPVYTLSPKTDKNPESRIYQHNGIELQVWPSPLGYATVNDKDILIYAISHCMQALNNGEEISNTIRFHGRDFLKATNRSLGGGYKNLERALIRLKGTTIKTNIKQGGSHHLDIFGLLERAQVVHNERTIFEVEIKLPDWIMDAIYHKNILTLHPHYFRLKKMLDKRLYEIARKHCGDGVEWNKAGGYFQHKPIRMKLTTLYKKSGSSADLGEFASNLRQTIESDEKENYFPEYKFILDKRKTQENLKGLDAYQVTILPKNTDRFQRKSVTIPGT